MPSVLDSSVPSPATKNWSEEDLEELDQKLDALSEHFGLEFVFEKVSDGSATADKKRVYARAKKGGKKGGKA